jgi:hypothetical protein
MVPNITVKASTTSITSNTTLANDSELTNIALAVGTWEIEVMLWAGAVTAGNLKTAWNFATGTLTGTPNRACCGPGSGNTAAATAITLMTSAVVAYTTSVVYGVNSTALPFYLITETCSNFVVATAGTFNVQVAQNASSGTATTIQPGSRVKCRQIA